MRTGKPPGVGDSCVFVQVCRLSDIANAAWGTRAVPLRPRGHRHRQPWKATAQALRQISAWGLCRPLRFECSFELCAGPAVRPKFSKEMASGQGPRCHGGCCCAARAPRPHCGNSRWSNTGAPSPTQTVHRTLEKLSCKQKACLPGFFFVVANQSWVTA